MRKKILLTISFICFAVALITAIYEIMYYRWNPVYHTITIMGCSVGVVYSGIRLFTYKNGLGVRYIIKFSTPSIFGYGGQGYFIHKWLHFSKDVKLITYKSDREAYLDCTKFRYRWIADLWCKTLNKQDYIRTWYVCEILVGVHIHRGNNEDHNSGCIIIR